MSFDNLPVSIDGPVSVNAGSFKRWAALTPSDSTVYDPPPDALLILASSGDLVIVGSDDVSVAIHFGSITSGDPHGIFPFSPKKVVAASTFTPIGLWRE